MEQTEAKFVVAQANEMIEQHDILESIKDEAYVMANQRFICRKGGDRRPFDEFKAEMDAETATENLREPELWLLLMYPPLDTELVDISHEEYAC
ncbi:putative LRR receptor-like serine/threonine-protein kinase [Hordeum vulgare]|nr:putative LRR receptor-like serine/threonine-protein kinase [Hordeum vulgare]